MASARCLTALLVAWFTAFLEVAANRPMGYGNGDAATAQLDQLEPGCQAGGHIDAEKPSLLVQLGGQAASVDAAAAAAASMQQASKKAAKVSPSKAMPATVVVQEAAPAAAASSGEAPGSLPRAADLHAAMRSMPGNVAVAVNMQPGGRHISFSPSSSSAKQLKAAGGAFVSSGSRSPSASQPGGSQVPSDGAAAINGAIEATSGAMDVTAGQGVFQQPAVTQEGKAARSPVTASAMAPGGAVAHAASATHEVAGEGPAAAEPSAAATPQKATSFWGWITETLFAIGGGTGATIGGTGDPNLDQDMVRRMRYQDKAVMLFLMLAYTGSLAFSANIAYRQACNNSPVTYYADPRYHNMVVDTNDIDNFLEVFNQPPKDVQLQVTGFVPLQDPEFAVGNVDWYGMHYHVAFSFALDLSPWVVRGGVSDPSNTYQYGEDFVNSSGISEEDLATLSYHLERNTNDLAILELQKEVLWNDWEELAMNIKHQIRQAGFGGLISVHRSESENVHIYKNKSWANFMHSRTTKVLWALSLVGWLFYQPYMWLRCTSTTVRSRYRIDIPISQFWPFIEDKIGADGFNDRAGNGAPDLEVAAAVPVRS